MLTAFAILTDGLVYAAYLFIVAVGLTLIFGVMKILNVTHGSFYAFGAYGAATAVGIYTNWRLAGGARLPVHAAGSRWRSASSWASCSSAASCAASTARTKWSIVLVTYAAVPHSRGRHRADLGPAILRAPISRWSRPAASTSAISCCRTTISAWSRIAAGLAGFAYWALKYTRYGRLLTAVIYRPRNGGRVRHQRQARVTP